MSATEQATATLAKQTTIAALKPQPEAPVQSLPAIRSGFDNLQAFELMQRGAKLLAASTLVPKEYQGNLPNCVIALNMAQRIGADPLLVMQNLYVVHGRPGWSAQFLIACFNQCGRFSAIRYRWLANQAAGDEWGCQAYAKELSTGDVIEGPQITIGLAKKEGWVQKNGSKWQTIPQLMLMYRAAAWLVRTHAPEISMGLQTAEELGDVYDAQRGADGRYSVTLEGLREGVDAEIPAGTVAVQEVIDTKTGEVVTTASKPSQTIELDTDTIENLRAAKDAATLNNAWKIAKKAYKDAGVVPPPDVETVYTDRLGELSKAG